MIVEGSLILITGGARGLGKGFVEIILKHGGKVVITDVLTEVGKQTEKEFNTKYPGRIVFYTGDVTDEDAMRKIWEDSEKHFDRPIDVLVNNAGVNPKPGWRKVLDINLVAVMSMTYLAIEKMSKANSGNGGRIINSASVAGLGPASDYEMVPYTIAKSAVITLTRSLATKEIFDEHGVSVAALCPFYTNTDMVDDVRESSFFKIPCEKYGDPLTIERVVNVFFTLLNATDRNGAVMKVMPNKDAEYVEFPSLM